MERNNITESVLFTAGQMPELLQLLQRQQEELNLILELTEAINKNAPAYQLFEMLESIFTAHDGIGRMRLIVREGEDFRCAAQFGGVQESRSQIRRIWQKLLSYRDIILLSDESPLLKPYDFFVPVTHKDTMLAFALIGGDSLSARLSENDLKFVQTYINVIVVALENKRLFKERLQAELLKREMSMAREVQNKLIPLRPPIDRSVDIGCLYMPSHNIGGDYFDFIWTNDHEFVWCIADVSGKGIAAALMMSNLQASFRALVVAQPSINLKKLVAKLNQIVSKNTHGDQFVTLFLGKYNQQTKQMHYINAGHNPPILLINNDTFLLKQGTVIIGAFEELPFINVGCVNLLPGTLICNYTDGLIESADEEVFVQDSELISHLKKNRHLSAEDLNYSLLADIQKLHKAKMNSDDITMLTMKIS